MSEALLVLMVDEYPITISLTNIVVVLLWVIVVAFVESELAVGYSVMVAVCVTVVVVYSWSSKGGISEIRWAVVVPATSKTCQLIFL